MAKSPTSFRLSALTERNIKALSKGLGLNAVEVVATAVDRMYQQEFGFIARPFDFRLPDDARPFRVYATDEEEARAILAMDYLANMGHAPEEARELAAGGVLLGTE